MTVILGPRALRDIAIPTGVDATTIFNWQLRDGTTSAEAIATAAAAIGLVNQQLQAKYGNYFYITQSLFARYRQGGINSSMTPEYVEFSPPPGRRGALIGHMLPMRTYRDSLEWTALYLRDADMELLRADVGEIAEAWYNRFDYEFWTRALTDNENAIGSAGYDVGWANGGGTVAYVPPSFMGETFTTSHTHFVYKDDTSLGWADVFDAQMDEMLHHGIQGPFDIFCNESTDVAEIVLIDGFVPLIPANMMVVGSGSDNPRNPFVYMSGVVDGTPGSLFGYYRSETKGIARLFKVNRIPTNYCWLTKGYGINSPSNPMAIRVHPKVGGFGLTVIPKLDTTLQPELEKVQFMADFGVGVNNRLGGVGGYLYASASAWVDPTIS